MAERLICRTVGVEELLHYPWILGRECGGYVVDGVDVICFVSSGVIAEVSYRLGEFGLGLNGLDYLLVYDPFEKGVRLVYLGEYERFGD